MTVPAVVLGTLAVAAALAVLGRAARSPAAAHRYYLLAVLKLMLPAAVLIPIALPARAERGFGAWAPAPVPPPGPTILLGLWAAASAGYLAVVAVRSRRLAAALRYSRPADADVEAEVAAVAAAFGIRPPRVRVLPGRVPPFVWAAARPTLYLPDELFRTLPPERRAAVLAHELAHVARGDHFVRWVDVLAGAAFWWCPPVTWLRKRLRAAEEAACDARAAAATPGGGAEYAEALLDVVDFVGGGGPDLRSRVVALVAPPRPPAGRRWLAVAAVAAFTPVIVSVPETPVLPTFDRTPPQPISEPAQSADRLASPAPTVPKRTEVSTQEILSTKTSIDGRYSASGYESGALRVRDPLGRELFRHDLGTWVSAIAFDPAGQRLFAGGYDGKVRTFDLATGRQTEERAGHRAGIRGLAVAASGTLASLDADGTLIVWAPTGPVSTVVHDGPGGTVSAGVDGFATNSPVGAVRYWDTAGRPQSPTPSLTATPTAVTVQYEIELRVTEAVIRTAELRTETPALKVRILPKTEGGE